MYDYSKPGRKYSLCHALSPPPPKKIIHIFKNLTIAYCLLPELQGRNYLSSENLRPNKISFSFKYIHYFT